MSKCTICNEPFDDDEGYGQCSEECGKLASEAWADYQAELAYEAKYGA